VALACAPSVRAPAGELSEAPPLAGAEEDSRQAILWPDEPFRATAPEPGPPPALTIPTPHRFTTDEGVEVLLVEDRSLPIARLEVAFELGAVDDPRGREGLHSLCFDLFDESTRRLKHVAFEEAKDDHGVRIDSSAGTATARVSMSALAREFDTAMSLWGEVLTSPGLRSDDFRRVVDHRIENLDQSRATHVGVAARALPRLVYGDQHPYGRQVTETSLRSIRASDCAKVARSLGMRGARVYASGAIDEAAVRSALQKVARRLKRAAPSASEVPAPELEAGVYFIDVPDSVQSSIAVADLGPSRGDPAYAAQTIMMRVLGGGFSSRINMNLREDKGYSYGARASVRYQRFASYWAATARVRTDATVDSVRQVLAEIERMRTSSVTKTELRRERDGTLAALPASFATAGAVATSFARLDRYGLQPDWYAGYDRDLQALTADTVSTAAAATLPEMPRVILVVGDGEVVRDDLEKLAASRGENLIDLDRDGGER
jgi:predicted Zn-dependent peptidase